MKITISSPAKARLVNSRSLVEASTLQLPILLDQACIADDLSQPLVDAGVIGGEVWLRKDKSERLVVDAVFWSPQPLGHAQIDDLVRETTAQWADGIGEGGLVFPTQIGTIRVHPDESADAAQVTEEDDGRPIPVPSRVAKFARDGRFRELEAALKEPCDINADLAGYNALHLAILGGNVAAALLLIERGIDVARGDRDGETPLALTALARMLSDSDSVLIANALLARVATDVIEDSSKALEYARMRGKERLASMLEDVLTQTDRPEETRTRLEP